MRRGGREFGEDEDGVAEGIKKGFKKFFFFLSKVFSLYMIKEVGKTL